MVLVPRSTYRTVQRMLLRVAGTARPLCTRRRLRRIRVRSFGSTCACVQRCNVHAADQGCAFRAMHGHSRQQQSMQRFSMRLSVVQGMA